MNFFQYLKYKGLVKDCSSETTFTSFIEDKDKVIPYCGFDLTAKSLHVGNLITILTMRQFFLKGHKIILLLGNATTRIGDPSDKNEIRKMLSIEDIELNKIQIKECINKFIPLDHPNVEIVENYSWFKDINYLDFLREIGTYFTINKMINIDFVKRRINQEQPITFLEFNYMLMQAYDFLYLNKKYKCNLQIGGSDQWGNIIQGVELIKRVDSNQDVFGLTIPLLTDSNGNKIGKTTGGAIWLHEKMLDPYDYFQYFRNTKDDDVIRFLKIFTDFQKADIEKYSNFKDQDLNYVKEILAFEATKMCHGKLKAEECMQKAKQLFGSDIDKLEAIDVAIGTSLIDLLITLNLFSSKSEARRKIEEGAIRLDQQKINDIKFIFDLSFKNKKAIISIGKNKKYPLNFI